MISTSSLLSFQIFLTYSIITDIWSLFFQLIWCAREFEVSAYGCFNKPAYWQISWCDRVSTVSFKISILQSLCCYNDLTYKYNLTVLRVVYQLFCLSFTHWCWVWSTPLTWSKHRTHGGCEIWSFRLELKKSVQSIKTQSPDFFLMITTLYVSRTWLYLIYPHL